MTELSVTMPEEPADEAVVLDRQRLAWQRRGSSWQRVGAVLRFMGGDGVSTWAHLVVDHGPLTLLKPMDGDTPCIGDGWRDAGFTAPGCTSFTEPSPADAPTDGPRDAGFDGPDCRRFAQTA